MTAQRPQRIQRRRTAGWRMPSDVIYVGRPTRWGNPFSVADHGATEAVRLFRAHLLGQPLLLQEARQALAGRPLACWCRLDRPCHADVLLELVNREEL
jgi:hypothetical protein